MFENVSSKAVTLKLGCATSVNFWTFVCADEVDETASTRKWSKKAADQLEKLNNDCNRTAGLETKLELAVGARVMLRQNIDIKAGLVNVIIGTVCSLSSSCVTVQFDHIAEPYDVQHVKSKFMLMKSFYVYRMQFPLILAFAVTIHKWVCFWTVQS